MKLRKLFQRMAAALVAGAMALSLSAPALAAQGTPPDAPDLTGCDFAVRRDTGSWHKVSEATDDILGDGSNIAYANGVISSTDTLAQSLYIIVAPGATVDVNIAVADGPAVLQGYGFAVDGARNVTLSGSSADGVVIDKFNVACSGSLTVENTSDGNAANSVRYSNISDTETVVRLDGEFGTTVDASDYTTYDRSNQGPAARITAGQERTYTATVENGYLLKYAQASGAYY